MEFGVSFIVNVFNNLFAMADRIYTRFGVYPFIYGLFFIFVVVKVLLIPIFGGSISAGSSDIAANVERKHRHEAKEWNNRIDKV